MGDASRVIRCAAFRWDGVPVRDYGAAPGVSQGVQRQILAEGAAAAFETRYFEVAPGGFTRLEEHAYAHVVVVLRGAGHVRLGEETTAVQPGDCVYVAPGDRHQFRAGDEIELVRPCPSGFDCDLHDHPHS